MMRTVSKAAEAERGGTLKRLAATFKRKKEPKNT